MFLPQRVGLIENMLTIKTNMGNIIYRVVGVGMHNPYRLHPFFGAKVAVNMPWTTAIEIYNPHAEPLTIKEIYTSGASLMLALPSAASSRNELGMHQMFFGFLFLSALTIYIRRFNPIKDLR